MSKTEEVIGLEPVTQKKPKGRPRKYLLSRKERRGIEEQADLLAELEARYKQNPLKWFVPTGAQEDFIKAIGGGNKLIGIDSGANRVGKTALMVNILGNIVFGPQSEWFNHPIFREWPYAKNARIGTNPTNLSEIGAIQKGIEEYWPQGRYTAVKQGKTYNSLYKTDTNWTIDLMCLRPDQRILMSDGTEIPIKDIQIGDKIKCSNGDTKVTNKFNSNADEFYKIRTSKGNEIVCSYKHKILTQGGWIRACDLTLGDICETPKIKHCPSTEIISDENLILLGVLIGDGHIKGLEIKWTCFNEGLYNWVNDNLPQNLKLRKIKDGQYAVTRIRGRNNNPFKIWLEELGLWGKLSADKFIPGIIFKQPLNKIALFLSALYSTDGSFGGHCISYTSRSKTLTDDVKKLLRKLGITAKVYSYYRESYFDGYDCSGIVNTCTISDTISNNLFVEKIGFVGKKPDFKAFVRKFKGTINRPNKISAIEIIDGGECLDIAVDDACHDYIVDGLIVHNSYDQSVKEWESVKLSLVLKDEPPPEPILSATQARLADGGMILIFMTPLGDAGYIFDNLIENPDMKDRVVVCYSDIESSCKEHGIRGFREHRLIEDLVKSLSPEDLEARAHGKPMHLSGSIYKIFNQSVHIIDDFGIPDDWYRVQIVDPHDAFPFGMIWAAFSPTQNCYIYKEYPTEPFERIKGTNLTFDDYKDIIITAEYKENIERRIMDPNFGAKRYANTGKTVRGEMFDRGFIYELCRTDDLAVGHNIVRDWLSYDPSKPLGMGNDPKLKIFRSCRNTWVSMIRYGWKPNLKDEHSDSLKLVQKYKHFADMVRYLAVTNPMYEAAEKTKYAGLSGLDRKVAEEIDNLVAV